MSEIGACKDLIQALQEEVRSLQVRLQSVEAELHDGALQRIIAAHMELQAMLGDPDVSADQADRYEVIDGMLSSGIDDIRKVLSGTASVGAPLGTVDDLQELCAGLASADFAVNLVFDADWEVIPESLREPILLILREGIWNAKKHSATDRVVVHVKANTGGVSFLVQDNGQGFDPDRVDVDRFGLCTMLQRARTHGLQLHIDSELKQGTRIVLQWKKTECNE